MTGRRFLLLAGTLTVFGFVATPSLKTAEDTAVNKLTPDELKAFLSKEPKLFFLDVREPREVEQLGTIRGYVNIPIVQLEARLSEIPKDRLIVTA